MVPNLSRSPLADPTRLRALEWIDLMGTEGDVEFDRVSALAAHCVRAPISLVALVGEDCQVFPGAVGLGGELAATRRTPLSHSFCQHVVIHEIPLIITDARGNPLVADNPSIQEYGVIAYMGFPITTTEGIVLGSFCVIDSVPREWTVDEISLVREFTAIVAEQLENRMARARARNALDVVIHDLKTPLAGVTMATGLLMERFTELPAKLHPLVEVLSESSEKALQLLKTLSSSLHAPTTRTATTSLSEVLTAQTEDLRRRALAKEIGLELELASELPGVAAERWVVERILENLVGNALKFSPLQSTVRIVTRHEETWVTLEISDQGPGFSEADRERLFQRYANLSALPTGGEPSTGVGLSIVKRLVDQAAGRILLQSGPGEGAVFVVMLPVAG